MATIVDIRSLVSDLKKVGTSMADSKLFLRAGDYFRGCGYDHVVWKRAHQQREPLLKKIETETEISLAQGRDLEIRGIGYGFELSARIARNPLFALVSFQHQPSVHSGNHVSGLSLRIEYPDVQNNLQREEIVNALKDRPVYGMAYRDDWTPYHKNDAFFKLNRFTFDDFLKFDEKRGAIFPRDKIVMQELEEVASSVIVVPSSPADFWGWARSYEPWLECEEESSFSDGRFVNEDLAGEIKQRIPALLEGFKRGLVNVMADIATNHSLPLAITQQPFCVYGYDHRHENNYFQDNAKIRFTPENNRIRIDLIHHVYLPRDLRFKLWFEDTKTFQKIVDHAATLLPAA